MTDRKEGAPSDTSSPEERRFREASRWVAGIIFQGERLQAHLAAQDRHFDGRPKDDLWNEEWLRGWASLSYPHGHEIYYFEECFFMHTLDKARRWVDIVARDCEQLRPAVREFKKAVPDVDTQDVRDMREHDEEYLAGVGRKQQRYERPLGPGEGSLTTTAHYTVVTGTDDYLIGGRVSVPKALPAARCLLAAINKEWAAFRAAEKEIKE